MQTWSLFNTPDHLLLFQTEKTQLSIFFNLCYLWWFHRKFRKLYFLNMILWTSCNVNCSDILVYYRIESTVFETAICINMWICNAILICDFYENIFKCNVRSQRLTDSITFPLKPMIQYSHTLLTGERNSFNHFLFINGLCERILLSWHVARHVIVIVDRALALGDWVCILS